jgi:gas vesicle protein GvpG
MILFKLLALPISVPAAGIRYCIEKVVEFAEHEMTDDEPVRVQLMELQLELEEGRVTEDEFAEREAVLLARLREIREYRKQMAIEAAQADSAAGVEAPAEGEHRSVVIEVPEELK